MTPLAKHRISARDPLIVLSLTSEHDERELRVVPAHQVAALSEIRSSPTGAVLTWETGAMGTIVSISQ